MSWRAELEDIRRERWRMKNERTVAGVALYERAIRLCDANRALDEAFAERSGLMNAVYYTGDWDKLLVHFGWCLAQHDRDPERFPARELLWRYKWVVNEAPRMPQIARPRVMGLLDDLERRFRAAGSTMRPVHLHRAYTVIRLGEPERAQPAAAAMQRTERDWLSDCLACESDGYAWVLETLGDEDAALAGYLAVIRGTKTCDAIPHSTHSSILDILWRRGERDRALHHHRLGYSLTRDKRKLVSTHGAHLAFASVAGCDDEVAPMLERHLPAAMATPSAWDRMYFYAMARLAVRRLAARGRATLAIRVPDTVDAQVRDRVDTRALADWFTRHIDESSAAFDSRNGNSYVSGWIADLDHLYG